MKTFSAVSGGIVIGVVTGVVVSILMLRDPGRGIVGIDAPTALDSNELDHANVDRLMAVVGELIDERFAALENRVDVLARQQASLAVRESSLADAPASPAHPDSLGVASQYEEVSRRAEEIRERFEDITASLRSGVSPGQIERLLEAGFSQDRIDWIVRRSDELQMDALQARHQAQHGGSPPRSDVVAGILEPESRLREEMGAHEYERYLEALGRPTSVAVDTVLAGSPAEQGGLRPGDEIVSYDGRRVYSVAELNSLATASTPGNAVVVDIRRDGQMMQVAIPSGPIGLSRGLRQVLR